MVGLDRWALRVAAYAGLMTDRYPPFRLDMGGTEPAAQLAAPETAPAEAAAVAGADAGPAAGWCWWCWAAWRRCWLSASPPAAAAAVVIDHTQRDSDGYLMSPNRHLSTGSYALVSKADELGQR